MKTVHRRNRLTVALYMSNLEPSLCVSICLVAAFLLGLGLQFVLPDHHLSREAQHTVKQGIGLVVTMGRMKSGTCGDLNPSLKGSSRSRGPVATLVNKDRMNRIQYTDGLFTNEANPLSPQGRWPRSIRKGANPKAKRF